METIFFYKITIERGTKTVFTYAHVKWFYGQSERAYYLNYFINVGLTRKFLSLTLVKNTRTAATVTFHCLQTFSFFSD